jgi:hypothetical protein
VRSKYAKRKTCGRRKSIVGTKETSYFSDRFSARNGLQSSAGE